MEFHTDSISNRELYFWADSLPPDMVYRHAVLLHFAINIIDFQLKYCYTLKIRWRITIRFSTKWIPSPTSEQFCKVGSNWNTRKNSVKDHYSVAVQGEFRVLHLNSSVRSAPIYPDITPSVAGANILTNFIRKL